VLDASVANCCEAVRTTFIRIARNDNTFDHQPGGHKIEVTGEQPSHLRSHCHDSTQAIPATADDVPPKHIRRARSHFPVAVVLPCRHPTSVPVIATEADP